EHHYAVHVASPDGATVPAGSCIDFVHARSSVAMIVGIGEMSRFASGFGLAVARLQTLSLIHRKRWRTSSMARDLGLVVRSSSFRAQGAARRSSATKASRKRIHTKSTQAPKNVGVVLQRGLRV